MTTEEKQSAAPQRTSDERTHDRATHITAAAACAAPLIAVFAVLWTTHSSHSDQVREDRVAAYSDYAAELAVSSQFTWTSLALAGTDRSEQRTPQAQASFWQTAQSIQAKLEASYVHAILLADGTAVAPTLTDLHTQQSEAFLRFKCMSALQTAQCEIAGVSIAPTTQDEVRAMLNASDSTIGATMQRFISAATNQVR